MIRSKKVKLMELELQVKPNVSSERYGLAFLSIYNNVRENPSTFLRMHMTYDSQLFFYIKPEDKEVVIDWLKNFADVWNTENITIDEEFETTVISDYDDIFNNNILLHDSVDLDEFEN